MANKTAITILIKMDSTNNKITPKVDTAITTIKARTAKIRVARTTTVTIATNTRMCLAKHLCHQCNKCQSQHLCHKQLRLTNSKSTLCNHRILCHKNCTLRPCQFTLLLLRSILATNKLLVARFLSL
jgi:hypothetical protein